MRKRHVLLVVFVVFAACLAPARADANVGWWDWLEQLSGPGPFGNGFMVDVRLACQVAPSENAAREQWAWIPVTKKDKAGRYSCITNADSVRSYVAVRGGRITSAKKPLFDDAPGEFTGVVAAHSLQSYFMRELDPSLAIGAGAGWMWFTGDNLDKTPKRFVFTPISVSFMPLRLLGVKTKRGGSVLVLRAEEVAIVGGMKATDFNSGSRSKFEVRTEVVRSVSVVFDIGALFNK